MSAVEKDKIVRERIASRTGVELTDEQARTFRRAELTLHRWGEQECGDGNSYASWAIERDEKTGKPYMCVYPHKEGHPRRTVIADRESGALNRVAALCKKVGLHYYHQTDPRGCALYVSRDMLDSQNYWDVGTHCSQ